MGILPPFGRGYYTACACVLLVVCLMLALGVIPDVRSDTYERADPDMAATAFWVNFGIALAAAAVLGFGGLFLRRIGGVARFVLILVGVVVLLSGLALVDATGAFGSHGPHMSQAMIFMSLGAAGEILVGLMTIWAAVSRPGA